MSEMSPELILEIWESFKDYVPVKERSAVCYRYIEILDENGVSLEDLSEVEGEDKHLDKVIKDKLLSAELYEEEWEE